MARFIGIAARLLGLLAVSSAVNVEDKTSARRANSTKTHLRQTSVDGSFVRILAFKHVLRVCNAYPHSAPMDIYHGQERITDPPLSYKMCHQFAPPIKEGDKLQFKIAGSNAGSFAISGLPNNDAVLVLVVFRHDTTSSAVAFESHIFANLINAQIAVLDTYKGRVEAFPRIQDISSARTSRSEELRYDSVVAVNPGLYEVVLQDQNADLKARQSLVALNRESYVVIRCGVEAQEGQSYPQELMVFPHSDAKALMGMAASFRTPLLTVLAMMTSWVMHLV